MMIDVYKTHEVTMEGVTVGVRAQGCFQEPRLWKVVVTFAGQDVACGMTLKSAKLRFNRYMKDRAAGAVRHPYNYGL